MNMIKDSSQITQYTGRNFQQQVLESDKPVVVICAADWNGDVYIMTPIIEELVRRYADRVNFGKLNLEKYTSIANQYCIRQNLTLLLFKGGQLINQIQGSVTKESLINTIEELIRN